MKIVHLLVLGWAFAMPLAASAQWQWIDKDGHKVFSDQSPPPDVPEHNILRRPGRLPAQPIPGTPTAAEAPAPVASKPSGVDKALEEKTRQAQEADKAKRAAEEQKVAQAKAENCNRARQGMTTLDSGIRIARVDANGERVILDDQARAAEQQQLQQVISSDCK